VSALAVSAPAVSFTASPSVGAGAVGGSGAVAAGAPPFLLPGEHFAAALAFLLAGAVGAVAVAPDLAAGFHLTSRVAAVTHLFTLGWITTSIMGALYQFLPVALGQPIRSIRLAHATFALYVPGLLAFVAGLLAGRSWLMLTGAATFGTGVMLFAANLGMTLRRARRRDVTWWALAAAGVFLVITLVFGVSLAGNLRWAYLGGARMTAVGTHLHVALAGWVLLVMIGVAHRLLPMFLLSHGAADHFAKAAVTLVAAGAGTLAAGHHGPPFLSRYLPALLVASGMLCFLAQARQFYATRHRPSLDPGMRLAAAALVLLAAGLAFAAPVIVTGAPARIATAYVLLVVLGISAFVGAHYYKIVPFLVWYHRFGPLAGKRPLPRVAELYSARAAGVAGALIVAGAIAFTAGVALGSAAAARAAACTLAAGVAIEVVQMLSLARRKP
jgi:hypothetical protein